MNQISRKDFLRLTGSLVGGAGLAYLINNKVNSEIPANTEESFLPKQEEASFLSFHIEEKITPEALDILNKGFEQLGDQAEIQSMLNLLEDNDILKDFDKVVFKTRAGELLSCFSRLQQTYNHFQNNEPESEIRDLALVEIKKRFNKIALPLSATFNAINNKENTSPKDLFTKLYSQYEPLKTEVPIDPLIGEQIYDYMGNETWFSNFDMATQEGQLLGTYPFTRKFFYQSGIWLEEFSLESGTMDTPPYPDKRPEPAKVNETNYSLENYEELIQIPVNEEVSMDIMSELESLGLDRSFTNLVIRNSDGEDFFGGMVYIDRKNIERNGDINLFNNAQEMNPQFYKQYKKGILFTLIHEIFHVLSGKILQLNSIDRFKMQSRLQKLNLALNPILKQKELCDDSITNGETKNIFEDSQARIDNFSEGNRNTYLMQNLMSDVSSSIWPTVSQIGIYDSYFDSQLSTFVSVRGTNELDLGKQYAAVKYSESYFGLKLQKYFEQEGSKMTKLDKFVYQELISRFNSTGLYSESIIWYKNEDTVNYYSSTLPLLFIYTSMARNDNRFVNAIKQDIDSAVKSGKITKLEGKYKMRKIYLLSQQISERNKYKEAIPSSNVEEFLADQFAFTILGNLNPDIYNYLSGVKAANLIAKNKPDFLTVITQLKEKNLAVNNKFA